MEEKRPLEDIQEDDRSISLTSVSDGTVYSAFSETEQFFDEPSPGPDDGRRRRQAVQDNDDQTFFSPPPPPSPPAKTRVKTKVDAPESDKIKIKKKRGRPRAPDASEKLAALEALFAAPAISTRRKVASAPATSKLAVTTKIPPPHDVYDPLTEEFYRACQYGQVGLIESLLRKQSVPIDYPRLDTGDTGLHLAANYQQSEAIKLLLKAGANVKTTNFLRHQPRDLCPSGSITWRLLTDFEAMQIGSESATGRESDDRLLRAAWKGRETEVRKILHTDRADPNITDPISGSSPLHYAAVWNNAVLIRTLLSEGADPALRRPEDGATALHLACRFSSNEAVRILLEEGAAWEVFDALGRTPVDYSSKSVRRVVRKYAREHLKNDEIDRLLDATATQRFIEVSADDEEEDVDDTVDSGGGLAGSEPILEGARNSTMGSAESMSAREEKKFLQMMAIFSKSASVAPFPTKKRRGRPSRNPATVTTGKERIEREDASNESNGIIDVGVHANANNAGADVGVPLDQHGHAVPRVNGDIDEDSTIGDSHKPDNAEGRPLSKKSIPKTNETTLSSRQSPRHRAAARALTALFDENHKPMISEPSHRGSILQEIEAMEPLLQLHREELNEGAMTTTDDIHTLWFFLAPQVEDLYERSFPGKGRLRSRIPLSKTRSLTGAEQQILLEASLVDKFTCLRAHLERPLGSLSLLERDAVLAQFERAGGNLANVPVMYVDLPRLGHRDEGPSSAGLPKLGEAGTLPPKLKLKYKQRRSVDLCT